MLYSGHFFYIANSIEQRLAGGSLTPVGRGRRFSTTNWSLVLAAADTQHPNSQEALEELCQKYWPPVYAFIRYPGFDEAKAEDLTLQVPCAAPLGLACPCAWMIS